MTSGKLNTLAEDGPTFKTTEAGITKSSQYTGIRAILKGVVIGDG